MEYYKVQKNGTYIIYNQYMKTVNGLFPIIPANIEKWMAR